KRAGLMSQAWLYRIRVGLYPYKCRAPSPTDARSGSAADRQAVHANRGHTDADGHALAVFAASTHARIQLQIIADQTDLIHGVGAVADQRRALDRIRNLAVFDH